MVYRLLYTVFECGKRYNHREKSSDVLAAILRIQNFVANSDKRFIMKESLFAKI